MSCFLSVFRSFLAYFLMLYVLLSFFLLLCLKQNQNIRRKNTRPIIPVVTEMCAPADRQDFLKNMEHRLTWAADKAVMLNS